MADTLQQLLGKITAQREALQDPSITDELLSRYWTKNPTERKLDELVLTVLGLASGYQGIKAAREAPAVAEEAASSIPEVIQKLLGVRPGKGPTNELEKAGTPGTAVDLSSLVSGKTERGISSHHTLPGGSFGWSEKAQVLRPRLDPTSSLTDPPLVEPLGRPTSPLAKTAARTPGGRFHGTNVPISEVKNPLDVPPMRGQMVGRGLYTTNNQVIADSYAGIKDPKGWSGVWNGGQKFGDPGSVRYHAHQIAPVRWLNIEKPATPKLRSAIQRQMFEAGWSKEEADGLLPLPKESVHDWVRRFSSGIPSEIEWDFLQRAAESEGYGGLQHTGGKIMGDRLHKVKVYWHPEGQVRLRPEKYSLHQKDTLISPEGKIRPPEYDPTFRPSNIPRVSKPSVPTPKPKYIRDPSKTKLLTPKTKRLTWMDEPLF